MRELGIDIFFKLVHPQKTLLLILVTDSGRVIEVKLLHSKNTPHPSVNTEFGIVTERKLLQP